jgi:hypothetical protein
VLRLQAQEANVVLVSFTASSVLGEPEIYLEWETATEFDTVGFFIARSSSATGEFTIISEFMQHEGDTVVGAQYFYIDEDTVLNQTYYYRLDVLNTDQSTDYHGPIAAVAGVPPTITPTPSRTPTITPTSTPTSMPSPTATATTQSSASDNSTPASSSDSVATPRPVTGATVTPRPTLSSNPANPIVSAATATLSTVTDDSQPTADVFASPLPAIVAAAPVAQATSVVFAGAPESAPAPAPADAIPVAMAPVVVVTEAAPAAAQANAPNNPALLLLGAAVLFLGIAFVILRQARS